MQEKIHKLFLAIHNRNANDKEIQRILAVCRALDCKDNDAFIAVIASLESYGSAFDTQLEKIKATTNAAAEAAVKQSAEKAKENLAEIEKKIVIELAKNVEKTSERIARLKYNQNGNLIRRAAIVSVAFSALFISFTAGSIYQVKVEIEKGNHLLSDYYCTQDSINCSITKEIPFEYRDRFTVYSVMTNQAKIAKALAN